MNKKARRYTLSRHLLGAVCLTLAVIGTAPAATIVESPEPGGFGNSISTATVLQGLTLGPGWTNIIEGETTLTDNQDQTAFFLFDLLPGSSFTYSLSVENSATGTFQLTDTLSNNLGTTTPFSIAVEGLSSFVTVTSGTGTAPSNGDVVAAILQDAGTSPNKIFFNVTVTGDFVPEPGTSTEIGLGLAGVAAVLMRRLKTRRA
jgi:hypothetical protein